MLLLRMYFENVELVYGNTDYTNQVPVRKG